MYNAFEIAEKRARAERRQKDLRIKLRKICKNSHGKMEQRYDMLRHLVIWSAIEELPINTEPIITDMDLLGDKILKLVPSVME
jgi:hypothetical protein